MKSQDIFLLLKLVALHQRRRQINEARSEPYLYAGVDWQGWSDTDSALEAIHVGELMADEFSARGLEASLGISKSEANASIKRSIAVGMATKDRRSGLPKTNVGALLEFIAHGLKYVFPARPGAMVRGIPTAAAAPVLQGELISASEFICVWPDAHGRIVGQELEPLFKSVPAAVRRDADLYASLALVDAIRLGKPRESNLAQQLLEKRLKA